MGTMRISATTERVALARSMSSRESLGGLPSLLEPPEMKRRAVEGARWRA